MFTRGSRTGIAVLASLCIARTAFANPLPPPPVPEGALMVKLVILLALAWITIEWVVVRLATGSTVRREWVLVGVVVLANVLSYPATVATSDSLRAGVGPGFDWVAECAAVTVEFAVYVAAFHVFRRWSPFHSPPSPLRLLIATISGNALTWLLGNAFTSFWFRT